MDEYLAGEILGREYAHIQQSAIVINVEGPRLRFNTSRFVYRRIMYQSTCAPKIKVKYRNTDEHYSGEQPLSKLGSAATVMQFLPTHGVSIRD